MKITTKCCQLQPRALGQEPFNPVELLKKSNPYAKLFRANCARARETTIKFPANKNDFGDMPVSARKKFLNWTRTQWIFPLTLEGGHYLMRYCANRAHRQRWYEAYTAATRPEKNCDNQPVALILAQGYGEDAAIHGYEDFFAALLKDKMIKDPRVIEELLTRLRTPVAAKYRKNYEKFANGACAKHKLEKLHPWDFNYALARSSLGVPQGSDIDEFEKYFELGRVKKFLFAYLENIFDLRFIPQCSTPNPENYLVYDCRKRDGMATLNFAPSASTQQKLVAGQTMVQVLADESKLALSKISVSCDFMRSSDSAPVLLNMANLRTFFHEIGHVVENVFTAAACRKTAMQKPESDTEEFYSMFVENLVFEPEFLHAMSSHYQTGRKIPQAVSAPRLAREEFFDVLLNTSRWWEVSMKEREIHRGAAEPESNV